jgi:Na+/proline symporter
MARRVALVFAVLAGVVSAIGVVLIALSVVIALFWPDAGWGAQVGMAAGMLLTLLSLPLWLAYALTESCRTKPQPGSP